VLIQEDTGNQAYLAGVWVYEIKSRTLARIARHDPDRFAVGGVDFLTKDEEASGIIPAPFLGGGWYLLDVQNHKSSPTDTELVEGGQLLALPGPPGS
jgi:hypothetical protein